MYDEYTLCSHYAVDDVARVGKPLVDIEIEGEAEGVEEVKEEAKRECVP